LTGWQIRAEVAVILLFALLNLAILIWGVRYALKRLQLHQDVSIWLAPAFAFALFSISQWENWTQGIQIAFFMHLTAMLSGLLLLGRSPLRFKHLLGALFCGLVATYSVTNGLLFWPLAGILVLWPDPHRRWKVRLQQFGLLAVFAVMVVALYYSKYTKPAGHPSFHEALVHPLRYAVYVAMFLGSSMQAGGQQMMADPAHFNKLRLLIGLGGLAALPALSLWAFLRGRLQPLLPFVAMGLYSVGSAFAIGIARVGFGWAQALSPRYITISSWLWIGILVLAYALLHEPSAGPDSTPRSLRLSVFKAAWNFLAVGCVLAMLACSVSWYGPSLEGRYYPLVEARQQILAGTADDAMLGRVFPVLGYLRFQLDVLKHYRLSLFRDL